MTLNLIIWIM